MPVLEPCPARLDGEIVFDELTPPALERLRLRLSLPNPTFVALKRFHGFTGTEPPTIESLIEMPDGSVHLPRGCTDLVKEQLGRCHLAPRMREDRRSRGSPIVAWQAERPELRDYQDEAIGRLTARGQGLVILPCVAGDTQINLNRGGKGFTIAIADAYERSLAQAAVRGSKHPGWDPKIPTFIRSKVGDRIQLNAVKEFLFKGYRQTIALTFSNGRSLRLTPEHEVLTDHGFIAAQSLRMGDRAFYDGVRAKHLPKLKAAYRRLSWYGSHPFARRQQGRGGRTEWTIEEHRAIAEACINGLTLQEYRALCKAGDVNGLEFLNPKRFHVHHRDENCRNNDTSNLEVLTVRAHRRHHASQLNFLTGSPELTDLVRIDAGILEPVYDVVCEGPSHNFCANGIVVHNCGCGKTKLGVGAVLAYLVTTLVLVHTTDLADQWLEELAAAGIDAGLVGDGKCESEKDVVVGIVDTVVPMLERMPGWGARFGFVILDEAHHAPAATFQRALRALPAYYRLGLTATPEREDGLSRLVEWSFGDVLLERTTREMIALGWLSTAEILCVSTGFTFEYDGPEKKRLAALDKAVAGDLLRNLLIADTIAREAAAGETCLVLVREREHARELAEMITSRGVEARALTGQTGKRKRKATVADLRSGALPVACATSLADEGLDLPRLSVIALAAPARARGATIQRLGRLLRKWPGKKPRLYDFVDDDVDTLASRAVARRKVYLEAGLLQPAA